MEHDVTVPFSPDDVQRALSDPERLYRCLPGFQVDAVGGAEGDGDEVSGRLRLRVGSSTITYRGVVRASESGGEYRFEAEGREARGSGKAKATLTIALRPVDDGTSLRMSGTAEADGRIADAAATTVTGAVRRLLDRFVAELGTVLSEEAKPAKRPATAKKAAPGKKAASAKETAPEVSPATGAERGAAEPPVSGGAEGGPDTPEGLEDTDTSPVSEAGQSGEGAETAPKSTSDEPVSDVSVTPESVPERTSAPEPESAPEAASEPEPAFAPEPEPAPASDAASGPETAPAPDVDAAAKSRPDSAADAIPEVPSPEPSVSEPYSEEARESADPAPATARRTMIGRSAEEVDHAPPRGRYAPEPAPDESAGGEKKRWAGGAAAALVASAMVFRRLLRRRR